MIEGLAAKAALSGTQLQYPFCFPAMLGGEAGNGVDLLTGDLMQVGATVPATALVTEPINRAISHTTIVHTSDQYTSLMNAVANVQGSTLTASFSAGVNWLRQTSMSESSFSLVIGATVQSKSMLVHDLSQIALTDAAKQCLSTQGPDAFLAAYGTHCIIGHIYGGDFIGAVNIRFSSASDQTNFSASMSGKISEGLSSGSVNASFSSALSSIHNSYELDATADQNGHVSTFNSGDPDAMITAGNAFASSVTGDPNGGRQIMALGCPWSYIPAVQAILAQRKQPNALDLNVSPDVATKLRNELTALEYLINTADAITASDASTGRYRSAVVAPAKSKAVAAQNAINSLSLAQISGLSSASAQGYVRSTAIATTINAVANGNVAVAWSYAVDGTFHIPILSQSGVSVTPLLTDELWVISPQKGDRSDRGWQTANLGFFLKQDGNSVYLQGIFNWSDPYGPGGGHWTGPAIDLTQSDDPNGSPRTSTGAWQAYPWNQITVWLA
jgi:hypothetical protein